MVDYLAVDPTSGLLYLSSGDGIETFDPVTQRFAHFSNVRVDDLQFGPDGHLWGTSWPHRGDVLRFDSNGKAAVQLRFDTPIDSIAFGQAGTQLEGLLFVSSHLRPGAGGAALTMVDLATLQRVAVASGGPQAENLLATADGRLLVASSHQVDVVSPLVAPRVIQASPAPLSLVALPYREIALTFNEPMRTSGEGSVLDLSQYTLTRDGAVLPIVSARYDVASHTVVLSTDGLEVTRTRGTKWGLSRTVTATLWPDGHAEQGVPAGRPDLAMLESRLREPRAVRFRPLR